MATHRYYRYFTYIAPVIRDPIIRTYGSLILTILALSVFTIFAIKPTVETIIILQKKLIDQQQILMSTNEKSQNLSLGSNNYKTLVSQGVKEKINSKVPFSPSIGELSASLEDAARATEASISAIQYQTFTISPATSSATPALLEIPFIYNLEGTYPDLLMVLKNLATSSRLIAINSLKFTKIEGGGLLLSVSGKAYYLK